MDFLNRLSKFMTLFSLITGFGILSFLLVGRVFAQNAFEVTDSSGSTILLQVTDNGQTSLGMEAVTIYNRLHTDGGGYFSDHITVGHTNPAGWKCRIQGGGPGTAGAYIKGYAVIDGGLSVGKLLSPPPVDNTLYVDERIGVNGTSATDELYVDGKIYATGTITELSDTRLKKNIVTLPSALDKVLALRGVQFDWRQEDFPGLNLSQGRQIGLIAQEVAAVVPEVVSQSEIVYYDKSQLPTEMTTAEEAQQQAELAKRHETLYGVAYSQLIPILIEAIKEQQQIIDTQKARIDQIEAALQAQGILPQQ